MDPRINFAPEQAKAWLEHTDAHNIDEYYGDQADGFYDGIPDLVSSASNAGIFGGWNVTFYPYRDGDGDFNGGCVIVELPGLEYMITGPHLQQVDYFPPPESEDQRGIPAALEVLDTIAALAQSYLSAWAATPPRQ
jgi:hypothetical protein